MESTGNRGNKRQMHSQSSYQDIEFSRLKYSPMNLIHRPDLFLLPDPVPDAGARLGNKHHPRSMSRNAASILSKLNPWMSHCLVTLVFVLILILPSLLFTLLPLLTCCMIMVVAQLGRTNQITSTMCILRVSSQDFCQESVW